MQMQMPKPVGLAKDAAKQPRKKGLQNRPLCPPGLSLPTYAVASQLLNSPVTVGKMQDDMNLYKQFLPMRSFDTSGMSTGVPSSDSADSDDDSVGHSLPATPPVEPFLMERLYAKRAQEMVPPPPLPFADAQPRNPNQSAKNASAKARPQQGRNVGKRSGNGQAKTYMGIVLSRGSKNHTTGQCRPCQKNNTPEGCSRGADCNFCHYPHDEAKMAEVAVFSAKAQLRRLVSDGECFDNSSNGSEPYEVPLPMCVANHVISAQESEEPWYITCGPATPPVIEFQRLSF